ncbi:MAG: hypothetical protein WC832_04825, partial [Anaerolineales bacterium]
GNPFDVSNVGHPEQNVAKPKDARGNILANLKNAFHSAASSRNQKIHREEAKIAKMEKSFSTKDTNKYEAFKVIPPLRVLPFFAVPKDLRA